MVALIHLLLGSMLLALGLYNIGVAPLDTVPFAISYQLLAFGVGYLIRGDLRK